MMKLILCIAVPAFLLLTNACNKPAPVADTDLEGFEITQVPGSEFSKATKLVDGNKSQEGYLLNGQRNGLWLEYHPDGRISLIQHFVNGKLNGPVLALDGRGQITAHTDYTDGIYDGIKATYKFGKPQEEIPYVNGKIEGIMKKYYSSGKVMELIEYKNNVQDGYYRHFDEENVLDLEYVYKNGKKVSGGIVKQPE